MEDIFYDYQNKISRCLSKSEIYDVQDEIVSDEKLTEKQKDELLDISWCEADLIEECGFYQVDLVDCIEEDD